MKDKKYLLFDCDGVIWRGNRPIDGAIETLSLLEENGFKMAFITNNSSKSRENFQKKFIELGFQLDDLLVVNSAYGAAEYFKRLNSVNKIFVIGEQGIIEELNNVKLEVYTEYEDFLQAVCIGWDRELTYKKIADGMRVIVENNGLFVATNRDPNFPLENGRMAPGSGAGVSALATACEKEPDIVIGKPNVYLIDLTLEKMNCHNKKEVLFIGDRRTTDVLAGINANIDTILVRTGIPEDHRQDIKPTIEVPAIVDLPSLLL